jgi:Rab GDP dissociation inhibitor
MALQRDESYKSECAAPTMAACKVYVDSLATMLQSTPSFRSPYLYPQYGLSGLPEGFARACAVNGGAFCLNAGDLELVFEDGSSESADPGVKIAGVKTQNCRMFGAGAPAACEAPIVIGNPTFFPSSMRKATGERIVRSIFILSKPVPDTDNASSTMIILPQKWFGRKSDIYITVVGKQHMVAPEGKYIVICSTTVETSDPASELTPALKIIGGSYLKRFDHIVDCYEPASTGKVNGCFMTKSLDATANFEGVMADALSIYEDIFGFPLDRTANDEDTSAAASKEASKDDAK